MIARFAEALGALGPFEPAPHFAVAVSGGADSLALTLLADQFARMHGGHITALTVDHGLRAESRAEAETVAQLLRTHGIAHAILTPAHSHDINNLQHSARMRRYDALAEYCAAQHILHCLVAHHAGDQRETVGLHSARGDTADGGSGMGRVRNYRGVRFLRPLLGVEKSELCAYLLQQNIGWIEDPSNQNRAFARVVLRTELAKNAAQQISLTERAQQAGKSRAARDDALAAAAIACARIHPEGYATLALDPWRTLAPELATQLLADLLTTSSGTAARPRAKDTLRLHAALQRGVGRHTLHGCVVEEIPSPVGGRLGGGRSLLSTEVTSEQVMPPPRQTHALDPHYGGGSYVLIAREPSRVAAPVTLTGTGQLRWDNRFVVHYALPDGLALTLRALGTTARPRALRHLPAATPSVWDLETLVYLPHMSGITHHPSAQLTIGFAPAKPLAAASFWWLNERKS